MSRAINLTAQRSDVEAMCAKHSVAISAIEVLPSGGTRVVTMNSDDAAKLTKAFGSKVIGGAVKRTPLTTARTR